MELWIKSQDKQMLIKVFEVRLNWSNDAEIIVNSYTTDGCDYDYRGVGTYKTKDRALEVLDEIQHKLDYIYELSLRPRALTTIEHKIVYEMPEE